MLFWSLPLAVPQPVTVVWEDEHWENKGWGVHNVEYRRERTVLALNRYGDLRFTKTGQVRQFWVMEVGAHKNDLLYKKLDDKLYWINAGEHSVTGEPCHCHPDWTPKDYGTNCDKWVKEKLWADFHYSGRGAVAGLPVVRYENVIDDSRRQIDFPSRTEVSLAPEQGCALVEQVETTYNFFHLPTKRSTYRVVSFKPGEPDPKLFELPAGYRVVH